MILKSIQKVLSFGFSNAPAANQERGRQRRILNPSPGDKRQVAFTPAADVSGGYGRIASAMTLDAAMHGQQKAEHFPGPELSLLLKEKCEFAKQMGVA